MDIWGLIRGFWKSEAKQLAWRHIPLAPDTKPLTPNQAYVRLWVTQMSLANDVDWFHDQWPVVHAALTTKFADRTITITGVARPPEGKIGEGVWVNYPVTTWIPYTGGSVEVEAGLSALKGDNKLGVAIDVVKDFTSLVGAPLGSALSVAETVTGSVDKVLDTLKPTVVLGVHEGYSDSAGDDHQSLRPGYLVVVRAQPSEVDPDALSVVDGALHLNGAPLTGYDFIVLRIDGTAERKDWEFTIFRDLMKKAVEAHFIGDEKSSTAYRNSALSAAYASDDLTATDRIRVMGAIRDQIKAAVGVGDGAVAQELPSFTETMRQFAPRREDVVGHTELSLAELLDREEAPA